MGSTLITLTEWITRWYELKAPTITPSTLTSYKQVISRYIIPTIGNLKLVDVKVSTIRYLLQQFEHLSTRTQCYIYTMISTILKQAVNDELIASNPADKIKKPKLVKTRTVITLSKLEVQQFLQAIANKEHHAIFKLAFTTGLRRSELLGLRWQDVDFKKSTIAINQTVIKIDNVPTISKTTKNASSRLTISIDGETLAELKKHRLQVQKRMLSTSNWIDNDLVFPGEKGLPRYPDHLTELCKKYAILIDKPHFTFHCIRHTHATLLIENGVNFKVIQMRLGHSSFNQTMNTYSHVTPIMENDVIEKIEKIF